MGDQIDLSLDDIIKKSKKGGRGGGRGAGGSRGGGAGRGAGGARGGGAGRGAKNTGRVQKGKSGGQRPIGGGGGGGNKNRSALRGGGGRGGGRGGAKRGGAAATRARAAVSKASALLRKTRGGGVAARRGRGRGANRTSSNIRRPRNIPDVWDHNMFQTVNTPRGGRGGAASRLGGAGGSGVKLIVSNLEFGVSDSDIKELFSEFGTLKRSAVHYDKSGRSLGSADVVFNSMGEAKKAIKQYNGVPLDGRPMEIQIATSQIEAPKPTSPNKPFGGNRGRGGGGNARRGGNRGGQRSFSANRGGGGGGRGGRGGPQNKQRNNNNSNNNRNDDGNRNNTGNRSSNNSGRGRGGRGRGGRGDNRPKMTADELDKQLDAYNSKMDME